MIDEVELIHGGSFPGSIQRKVCLNAIDGGGAHRIQVATEHHRKKEKKKERVTPPQESGLDHTPLH